MASRALVTYCDDLDGGPAAETVRFGLDGVEYEIDLSERNAERLRRALVRYTTAGRRAGGRGEQARAEREQNLAIRRWARLQGFAVNDRGQVPTFILEQFHAAAAR